MGFSTMVQTFIRGLVRLSQSNSPSQGRQGRRTRISPGLSFRQVAILADDQDALKPAMAYSKKIYIYIYTQIFQKTLLRAFNPCKRNQPLKKTFISREKNCYLTWKKTVIFIKKRLLFLSWLKSSFVCLFHVIRKMDIMSLPPILHSELFFLNLLWCLKSIPLPYYK